MSSQFIEALPLNPLTPRELEIHSLVARGFPNRTIATELHINLSTVKSHVRTIFEKLCVTSRAQIITEKNGACAPEETIGDYDQELVRDILFLQKYYIPSPNYMARVRVSNGRCNGH